MAWKLKKSKEDEELPAAAIGATAGVVSPVDEVDADVDFETGIGPREAVFDTEPEPEVEKTDPYLAERMAAVDDAIAALTNSSKLTKKEPETAAPPAAAAANGDAPAKASSSAQSDESGWTLDAFAPYTPPSGRGRPSRDTLASRQSQPAPPDFSFGEDSEAPSEEIDFTSPVAGGATSARFVGDAAAGEDRTIDFASSGAQEPIELGSIPVDRTIPTSTVATPPSVSEPPALEPTLVSGAHPAEASPVEAAAPPPPPPVQAAPPPAVDVAVTTIVPGPTGPSLPPAGPPHLIVKLGPFTAIYEMTADEMVIGRPDPKTGAIPEISIEWDDAISRRHARIIRRSDRYYVEDTGSKNGTYLNGVQLPENTPASIKAGDVIRVGERTEITFQQ